MLLLIVAAVACAVAVYCSIETVRLARDLQRMRERWRADPRLEILAAQTAKEREDFRRRHYRVRSTVRLEL